MSAPDQIVAAIDALKSGGVVFLPTDTVYGLAVSPEHPAAVEKLYVMKRRPPRLNLPVMVSGAAMLRSLGVVVNAPADRLLSSSLVPGALTLALEVEAARAPSWLAGRDEVAVRIPDDERLLSILRGTGPLLVTSANAHGRPTPDNLADVLAQLDGRPDLAIDGGPLRVVPSTLVNCRHDPPVVEREGAVSTAMIEETLGCRTAS